MTVKDGMQIVAGHLRPSKGVSGRLEERRCLRHLSIWNLDFVTIWNLSISQSGIWNLSIQSFNLERSDVCMTEGDNAHRRHGPSSQRTANIAHPIAATQQEPRRTLSSLGQVQAGGAPAAHSPRFRIKHLHCYVSYAAETRLRSISGHQI